MERIAKSVEIVYTSTEESWIDDNEIMIHKSLENAVHDEEAAWENINTAKEMLAGRQLPTLSDVRKAKFVTSEARDIYSSKSCDDNVSCIAMVISNPVSSFIGNFFMKFNKPNYPMRLFTNEDAAYAWLLKHK